MPITHWSCLCLSLFHHVPSMFQLQFSVPMDFPSLLLLHLLPPQHRFNGLADRSLEFRYRSPIRPTLQSNRSQIAFRHRPLFLPLRHFHASVKEQLLHRRRQDYHSTPTFRLFFLQTCVRLCAPCPQNRFPGRC